MSGKQVAAAEDASFARERSREWPEGNSSANFPLAIANIRLDPSSPLPIHEQICQGVRSAIAGQQLPAGTLLPPSRELALHLGVARNTVVFAYARLVAEGLCVSNTRRGTRVASDFPTRANYGKSGAVVAPSVATPLRMAFLARHALESNIDRTPGGMPFALSASDPVLYPRTKLGRRIAGKFLGAPMGVATNGNGIAEPGRLQVALASYLRSARGVVCTPLQIMPVTGLEAALDLTARVLLDPGDTVYVQDPTMDIVHGAFAAARAQMIPVAGDAQGVDPARMQGPPARLIFVSPSVSFPYGVQMPEPRRLALLAAARAQNAVVFENDAYSELRYSGARLASLQGMDEDERVIYYSGFTETLGNSVAVGFLVVPPALVDVFAEVGRRAANAPPSQILDALAEFIEEHEYAVHARNVRSVFAKRMETAKQAFKAFLPVLPTSEPHGGLFVTVHCDERFDVPALCREAAGEGLFVRSLASYFIAPAKANGFVFGIGALPERSIRPAVQQLAALVLRHQRDRMARENG